MKNRFFRCVAAAFLALALTAAAAEEEKEELYPPLPDGIVAHISIENAKEFLDGAFRFVGDATEGTANEIPGELLSVLVAAYSPLPLDVWDMESEVHAVLVGDFGSTPTPVFVFEYGDFDALIAGLEDVGGEVADKTEEIGETDFEDVRFVVTQSGTEFFLADLGAGRAVASEDFEAATFAALHPDWDIRQHYSDADMFARIAVPASGADISEEMLEAVTDGAEELADAVTEAGLKTEIADWLTGMGKKYSGLIGEELEKAKEIRIEIDFDDGNLVLAFAARFADGSWTRKWAETMDGEMDLSGNDTEIAAILPAGAFTTTVTASLAELVPGIETISSALMTELAELATEQKDKDALNGFSDALFALNPGISLNASYVNAGRPYQIAMTQFDDSAKALELLRDLCTTVGGMAENSFADGKERVAFPVEKQTDGELEWYSWQPAPADAEGFGAFIKRLDSLNAEDIVPSPLLDADFRFYAAEIGGVALLTLCGPVDRDGFAAVLQGMMKTIADARDGDVAESPFRAPGAEDAVDSLDDAQLSVGLIDPDEAYTFFAVQDGDDEEERQTVAARIAEGKGEPAPAAFGFGGGDGNIIMTLVIPPETVRAVILDHEYLVNAEREAE